MARRPPVISHGFVLHRIPHRDSSLILEILTRDLGRVGVVAKGARRPMSGLRSVLLQFQPLECTLGGQGELRVLTRAEWIGGLAMPAGDALLFGFYLNELLVRLLPREDAHPEIYDAYLEAVHLLGLYGADPAILRRFEWTLLRHTGHAPDLTRDHVGLPIDPQQAYVLVEGQWHPQAPGGGGAIGGQVLLALAGDALQDDLIERQARRLTRQLVGSQLDGLGLRTRTVLQALQRLDLNHSDRAD